MIQTLTFILHEAGFKNVSSTIFSFSFQLVCFIVSVCCRSCKSTKKNENQGSRRVKRSLSLGSWGQRIEAWTCVRKSCTKEWCDSRTRNYLTREFSRENCQSPGAWISAPPSGTVWETGRGKKRVSNLFQRGNLRFHEQHVDTTCRR